MVRDAYNYFQTHQSQKSIIQKIKSLFRRKYTTQSRTLLFTILNSGLQSLNNPKVSR